MSPFFLKAPTLELRRDRLKRLLGMEFTDEEVIKSLTALGMEVKTIENGWQVAGPSYRFDLNQEVDLIEEVVRLRGTITFPLMCSKIN